MFFVALSRGELSLVSTLKTLNNPDLRGWPKRSFDQSLVVSGSRKRWEVGR